MNKIVENLRFSYEYKVRGQEKVSFFFWNISYESIGNGATQRKNDLGGKYQT